ncbi:NupC/NupG family nucleoside CNT transporter [Photobacterium sp. SDRW27]|uniref:NupC/NupG family nucleoside CNT transporter n=1 Tax=Photobacterium obscurum TaxID=2829490 RepID=UPI0022443AA4|nr:NupC/NupG family nucleoside CNT transporter [Photobacterium obscurum]MCW8331270.1 NupC/NupG family nucleoside CNT transporter [Photobacterium obscurum]
MIAVLGIFALLVLAWLLSVDKKRIPVKMVATAFLLQVLFALLVLYVPAGKAALEAISNGVTYVTDYGKEGLSFLFGGLATGSIGFVFAVNVLGIIIFFSALISMLYHIGVMQKVVNIFGGALQRVLGTGRAESLSATANIFVGMSEVPLVIKPYLKRMDDSQLFAVMVCGLASVAGSTMVGYAAVGVDLSYLIAASFMSAPAGLLMAKMIVPPSNDKPQADEITSVEIPRATNVVEALADGAMSGLRMAVTIGATLLAFISVIALLNGLLNDAGNFVGIENLSFELIIGYLFAPVALLIGVPWADAITAGSLIGQKVVMNEFVAFIDLMRVQDTMSAHSVAVVTFALCGFANVTTLAILIGGMGSLIPERRPFIAKFGLRAVMAGVLANLMSAAIVSIILLL